MAIVRYMDLTAPADMFGVNFGCLCVRWSTIARMDHSARQELKGRGVRVGEWYGVGLSSRIGCPALVKSNPSVHLLSRELLCLQRRLHVNQFNVEDRDEIDILWIF